LSIANINTVTYFAPLEPVIKDSKIFLHTVDHVPCLLFCMIWGIFPANPIGMHFPLQKFIELLDKPFFTICFNQFFCISIFSKNSFPSSLLFIFYRNRF